MIKCGYQGSLVKKALFWRRLTVCCGIPSGFYLAIYIVSSFNCETCCCVYCYFHGFCCVSTFRVCRVRTLSKRYFQRKLLN